MSRKPRPLTPKQMHARTLKAFRNAEYRFAKAQWDLVFWRNELNRTVAALEEVKP